MKHAVFAAFSIAALTLGLAALPLVSNAAPDPAPTPVPTQHPDFSSMMFLTGTWTCTQMLRGKQRPDTSTTTIGLDGAWMVTQDTAPPFDQYRTFTIRGTSYTGYDPTIKKWVSIGVDSGGGYFLSSTPGWQGNTMTSSGTGLDGSSGSDVLTKVSDTETNDDFTGTDAKGQVTKFTTHCTKTGS